jgi:hypothetical protein
MKRILTIFCLIVLFSFSLHAQENDYLTDRLEFLSVPSNGVLIGKSLPPPDTKGSYFLDDEWSEGGMLELYMGKKIENVQLKYNLNSNLIYVKLKDSDEHYFLEGNKIKAFAIGAEESGFARRFVNASEMSKDLTKSDGFYEVYLEGEPLSLLRSNYTYLKKANYMQGADMGRRNNEILKKMDYFIYDGKNLIELKGSKNKIFEIFGKHKNEVKDYAQVNSLNLKEPADLARAITYYNSL